MKKVFKKIGLIMLCLTLFTGVGISSYNPVSTPTAKTITVQAKKKAKINKKFKKAMDEYYKFYKKYCKFMKKYQKGGNTFTMLNSYTKLLKQQTKVDAALKKWKKKKMNKAELVYFTKINSKVLVMLSKV